MSGLSIFSDCKTLQEEAISHLKIHFKVPLHRSHFPLATGVREKAKYFGTVILYLLTLTSIQSVTESILFPTMAKDRCQCLRVQIRKTFWWWMVVPEGHSIIFRKTRVHEDLWTFQREVFKRVGFVSSNYPEFLLRKHFKLRKSSWESWFMHWSSYLFSSSVARFEVSQPCV